MPARATWKGFLKISLVNIPIRKGRYVVLSEQDFDKVRPESTRVIYLAQFADDSAIDAIYVDRAYLPGATAGWRPTRSP
jgi:non-homologous end joining protein Ku